MSTDAEITAWLDDVMVLWANRNPHLTAVQLGQLRNAHEAFHRAEERLDEVMADLGAVPERPEDRW